MSYGKFASAEELLKGYLNLEASFTKKCQYAGLLKDIIEQAGLTLPPLLQEQPQRAAFEIIEDNNGDGKEERGAETLAAQGQEGQNLPECEKVRSQVCQAPSVNMAAKGQAKEASGEAAANRAEEQNLPLKPAVLRGKEKAEILVPAEKMAGKPLVGGGGRDSFAAKGKFPQTQSAAKEQTEGVESGSSQKTLEKIFAQAAAEKQAEGVDAQKSKGENLSQNASEKNFATAQNGCFEKGGERAEEIPAEREKEIRQSAQKQAGGISADAPPLSDEELLAKYPLAKVLKLKAPQGGGGACVVTPFEKALLDALGDARALYQALANDEQYIAGFLDANRKLDERVLSRYALACARSTPPVIGKGSVFPSASPQKPKTLEEAKGLIKHYIK